MELGALAAYLERLEETSKRLELADIAMEMLKESGDDLKHVVMFAQGQAFPPWDRREAGIAERMMIKCISTATGIDERRVESEIAKSGDTGIAAQSLFSNKVQTTLAVLPLSLSEIYSAIEKIASMEGSGSQDRKMKHVIELLNNASPIEVKYLVRLLLGEMRLGVGEGIMRDAIAQAFGVEPEAAERAYYILNDYGEVAHIAREKGEGGLRSVALRIGRPLKPMLAQSVHSVSEALESFKPAAFEYKFDGMRAQCHISESGIKIFTRRLDDVTAQFPDVVEALRTSVNARECIVEGEAVAVSPEGKPLPFQSLSRRIKRKHNIAEMVEKLPCVLYLFDCMYLDGENMLVAPLKNRRKALKGIVKESEGLKLSPQLVTSDAAQAELFYNEALQLGHEGVMIKNTESEYKPGSRVGYMYKLKPVSETLDLVVVGAYWGEGRRATWLGSFVLACRDPDTNEFLEIGKMATGLTDEQLQYLTEALKEDMLEENGKYVKLRPKLVVEAGYQEIQKSPTYESGYALRFPKLVRIREDRAPEECDTVDRVGSLYERIKKR